MANILGLLTLNNTEILEVDDLPMIGNGTSGEISDLAILQKSSASYLFQKTANDNRLWDLVSFSNSRSANQFNIDFTSNQTVGEIGWVSTVSSGALALQAVSENGIFGVTRLTANNGSATALSALRSSANQNLAFRDSYVMFKTLIRTSGTTSSNIKIGFGITGTQADNTDHLIFKMDSVVPNWTIESRSASVTSSVNSGTPWLVNTWQSLEIHFNGLSNTANFFINNIFVSSISLGSNKNALMNYGMIISKTATAGGAATLDIDYIKATTLFNTIRL